MTNLFLTHTLLFLPVLAGVAAGAPALKAPDALAPAAPGDVKLAGTLGARLDACFANLTLVQDPEPLIRPFREKKEVGDGDWRCEYWGKWITAAAPASVYEATPAGRALVAQGLHELIATRDADGYIGTRSREHHLQGWDVWGRKYVLLGLLACYDATGDRAALDAACGAADSLISEIGPGKANIADLGYKAWKGLPSSSVLEPIVRLYQRTGEQRYLDFAQYIVGQWSKPSALNPKGMRLVEDALAGKPAVEIDAPKAYEMMSCYEGLCELYRVTGERQYLDACVKLADSILRDEVTIVGCGTSGELWCRGTKRQTGVVDKPMETCVTATWMKLCYQLLRLTGDARYADELEKNLYNGLLGALMPDGRWWAYFSHLMGVRVPSYVQHADANLSCCVLNGPRGLVITPSWAFMRGADGPVVNLYAPATGTVLSPKGRRVKLEVLGDYPAGGRVEIRVSPAQPEEFTLALRVPAWAEGTRISVAGEAVPAEPGSYARLHRRWRAGDRVFVTFDLRARLLEAPDGNGQVALARGPIVLSLDNRLAPPAEGTATLDKAAFPSELKPNPAAAKKIGAWMAFDVPAGAAGTLTFCDYASAGNAFSQQNAFRTWLPQPLDLKSVYDTGQTWKTLSHAGAWTDPPARPLRVADPEKDLALAARGAKATAPRRPLVGAIRWDAWHTPWSRVKPGSPDGPVAAVMESLGPKQYHCRAPFFARAAGENKIEIDGYTQEVMDREIAYAKAGGLDYWAFLLYAPDTAMSEGLSRYLSSTHKGDMPFCAIASPSTFGGRETFAKGVERLVKLMGEKSYLRVAGGRPLLYLFNVEDKWLDTWGGPEGARRLFATLHDAVRAAGYPDPYLVVMDFNPVHGKKVLDIVGGQALSSYATSGNGVNGTPYRELAAHARRFWERCAATGAEVVPLAMAGWDRRPRIEHPVPWETYQKPGVGMERYYATPTPQELAGHIEEAMRWAQARPEKCLAQVIITYAWNEHDEGGWLCPTLKPDGTADTSRLDALAAMLRTYRGGQ